MTKHTSLKEKHAPFVNLLQFTFIAKKITEQFDKNKNWQLIVIDDTFERDKRQEILRRLC